MTQQTTFSIEQKQELKTILREQFTPVDSRMNSFENKLDSFEGKLDRFENRLDSVENRLSSLEHNVERLNYIVTDHTVRLDRIEERLDQTLTKEFFLQYMDAFIQRLDTQHQELQALRLSSHRHDHSIETLEKNSQIHSKEIRSIKLTLKKH